MTRQELLDWLAIDNEQLDKLLARGLPAEGHGQYSMNDVADWLNGHGLTEAPSTEPVLPAGVFKTRREAAAALGRSIVTIDGWMAQGCPGENGHYDTHVMRQWRDARDRQLKRPATYGTPASGPSEAEVDELRNIVRAELLNQNSLVLALSAAVEAIAVLDLPADPAKRKHEIIMTTMMAANPFLVQKEELEPEVERRAGLLLETLPK